LGKGAYFNGEKISAKDFVIKENDDYYINYAMLVENSIIDSFKDVESRYIYVFYDYHKYEINYRNKSNVFIDKENDIYINYKYISTKTDYTINILKEGNYLYIEDVEAEGITIDKTELRSDMYIRSDIYKKINAEEKVIIYEYHDDWVYARVKEYIGYLRLDDIKSISTKKTYRIKKLSKNKKMVVGWDLFNRKADSIANYIYYEELDIVAPTWHSLDLEEIMTDWYLDEYYNFYKNKGVEFWGVFNNSFDRDLTSYYLRDRDRRKKVIKEIIDISKEYSYDGINLDFENLHYEDRDYLTLFIKELYIESKNNNLDFSVDITSVSESKNWSLIYNREEISKYSDYIILMAYDATTSPEQGIGPIASIPWVEESLKQLQKITKSNNIILGVPFYTRLWEINETLDGILYDSTALRVKSADDFISNNKIPIVYDYNAKQNYGEKKIENITYKIWIEDELSLEQRIDLVNKYNLNGIAIWALDYSTDKMWNKINDKIPK